MFTSIAWSITGKESYADRAKSLINTWFLDSDTYQKPNIEFAQVIRGPGQKPGNHFGILDYKK